MVRKLSAVEEPEVEARVTVMYVTPALAKDWLKKNIARNRKVVPGLVLKYAEDIRAGNWRLNGSTIVMGQSGEIIDGQHRLLAVIEAGREIRTMVAHGIPNDAFETVDSGRRRQPSDVLSILGYGNTTQLAALASMWLWWEKYQRVANPGSQYAAPTTQEIVACVGAHHADFLEAIGKTSPMRKLFGGASIHAFYWLKLGEIDKSDRDFFFERLGDGQALVIGDAIYALRQALLNMRARNRVLTPELMGGLIVKGWNKFRNREKAQVLFFNGSEKYPSPV